jgi:phosphatidylserine/phosphatidylglycerophosphate/cardiolipin synthase-like enzyme
MNKSFFSPGNSCRDAILSALRQASSSLKICVFTISDDVISKEILYRFKQGIKVKIITDNDKCYDQGSDIEMLANAGIEVMVDKSPNHMHHKFALIDKSILINGSYNWTRSAADHNHENIILSTDPELIKIFDKEFSRLWEQMMPY